MSSSDPQSVEASRAVLAHLAANDFPSRSALYAAIAREAIADDEVLALTAGVPWHELPPLRLLAAVRYLLLAAPTEPLAEFHADLTDPPRPADEAYPHFRAFCLRHGDELTRLVRQRAVQTNEVLRCASYMPAVAQAQTALGAELALVDVGSSAGLGLHLDRYAYDYGGSGALGSADGGVMLRCEVRGRLRVPVPATPPRVAHRVGLDRTPIDVRDPDAVRWLRACVWPGQGTRVELLLEAVEAARADPPRLVAGDAVRDLPALLDTIPEGLGVCVTTSVVLNYLAEDRTAFADALEEAGSRRPLAWVAFDTPLGLDGVDDAPAWVRDPADAGHPDCALVRLSLLSSVGREDRWLARSGYHGEWLEWMAPE